MRVKSSLVALLMSVPLAASAQQAPAPSKEMGRLEYQSRCASCHGPAGKGDGAVRPFLTKAPSDLTTLAKRYGGAFPTELVWEMIDGRSSTEIGPHGSREMPVWGTEFRAQAQAQPDGSRQPEWQVRNRIVSLLDYLASVQAK